MRRFFAVVVVIAFSGCRMSPNHPDNNSDINRLQQQVTQAMTELHFTPHGICPFTPEEKEAYDRARERALSNLLAAPQAQDMSLGQLEVIFLAGAQAAVHFDQRVILIDEADGAVLVSIYRAFCQQSSHQKNNPALYVFDRKGGYWFLEYGFAYNMEWLEDRWVGFVDVSGETGRSVFTFTHIIQSSRQWGVRHFTGNPRAPALTWLGFKSGPPALIYLDGYRKIFVPASSAAYLMPSTAPPCDFAETLHSLLPPGTSCPGCRIDFYTAIYRGDLTLEWRDGQYRLTDETSDQVTVVLSDYTRLLSAPPAAVELSSKPDLRPGSWDDYCIQRISRRSELRGN